SVVPKFCLHSLQKAHRFRSHDMDQRTALHTWKDGFIDSGCEFLLTQNQARTWSAQSLMCGSGYDLRVWHWGRMNSSGDQSSEVRHVHQIERTHLVGNLAHASEVDNSRVRASAADNELRSFLFRKFFQITIIDGFGLFSDTVRNYAVR